MLRFGLTLLLMLSGLPPEALAWGATGHRLISRMAIEALPDDIPAFLRTAETAAMIGELGREPDRSKGTGDSHDRDLNPGHYINLSDDFKAGGLVSIDPLPETREAYGSALGTGGSNEYRVGFLPYAMVDGWQQLMRDFAYWRADLSAERHAVSSQDRVWFAKDRRLRELIIVRDLGYWSHFVADASQPMHVSVHYDGWGDFPNPAGYTTQPGFHARFEGAFVASHVRQQDIHMRIRPPRRCECTIQTRTIAYLRATHSQVIPVYQLEKAGAFAAASAAGRAFAADRMAAAVSELRDLIVEAWRASADSTVGYPPVTVRDVESGKVNPIGPMRGLD